MKIEIDIDLESIIVEALKKKEISDIYVPPVTVEIPSSTETPKVWTEATMTNSRSPWEYGRKNGRRRSLEEMALHDLEREKGRRLTPEEKGETKAKVHLEETAENTVRDAIIKKARIDTLAAEGMAAASKELAEEKERRDPDSINGNGYAQRAEDKNDNITRVQEGMDKHDVEATIPKADKLNTDSLFR